jgi:hypothetical protein
MLIWRRILSLTRRDASRNERTAFYYFRGSSRDKPTSPDHTFTLPSGFI